MDINQLIQSAISGAKSEIARLEKCGISSEKRTKMVAMGIATRIAFNVLEPVTDKGIIINQFYSTNCEPLVDEIVSGINEVVLIDHRLVREVTRQLHYHRCLMVRGDVFMKPLLKYIEDTPAVSGQLKELLDDYTDTL